jgi:hypothetical protein
MNDEERQTPSNVETLKAAGLIVDKDGRELPSRYHDVFNGLTDEELCCLMMLKARLDAAGQGLSGDEHYAYYVVPP